MKTMAIFPALAALVFASCAPSTPAARIAARPELFGSLAGPQQELVREGRIDKGMGTDAVYLAWGRPGREFEGGEGGGPTLRWDYFGSTPVYSTGFHGINGSGRHGGYGRWPYYGTGIGPEVSYLPFRRASVLFRDGRVASWERSR